MTNKLIYLFLLLSVLALSISCGQGDEETNSTSEADSVESSGPKLIPIPKLIIKPKISEDSDKYVSCHVIVKIYSPSRSGLSCDDLAAVKIRPKAVAAVNFSRFNNKAEISTWTDTEEGKEIRDLPEGCYTLCGEISRCHTTSGYFNQSYLDVNGQEKQKVDFNIY